MEPNDDKTIEDCRAKGEPNMPAAAPRRTRAKFKCESMTKRMGWAGHDFVYSFEFRAVTAGSPENTRFFAATPGGAVRLDVLSSEAFEVGGDYYLDFELAAA